MNMVNSADYFNNR